MPSKSLTGAIIYLVANNFSFIRHSKSCKIKNYWSLEGKKEGLSRSGTIIYLVANNFRFIKDRVNPALIIETSKGISSN